MATEPSELVTNNLHFILTMDPYPAVVKVSKLVIFDQSAAQCSPDQIIAIAALQGLVARSGSATQIYRLDSGKNDYKIWLQHITDNHLVQDVDYSVQTDVVGLFKTFSDITKSFIIYNYTQELDSNNLDVVLSTAIVTSSIPTSAQFATTLERCGLTPLLNLTDAPDWNWFFNKYGNQISKNGVNFQSPKKSTFLLDFAMFAQITTIFTNKLPHPTATQLFKLMNPESFLTGWGNDELSLVTTCSPFSIFVHASDWAINLATLSNFPTDKAVQKNKEIVSPTDNFHTVCFLMTDGDNLQWLLDGFMSEKWYGSPSRGQVNLGWTLSPALARLSGPTLDYLYQNATPSDYFVAAPSGIGYILPDKYNKETLSNYSKLTSSFMEKSDLTILNILASSKDTSCVQPFLEQPNIDGIFYYLYENYSGMKGKIEWRNGKPIIGGRYNFWEGFETPQSLAKKLNKASTNGTSADGYSLIPVHVWSRTVDDVLACQQLLNPNVRVVKPNEFVELIKKNVKH